MLPHEDHDTSKARTDCPRIDQATANSSDSEHEFKSSMGSTGGISCSSCSNEQLKQPKILHLLKNGLSNGFSRRKVILVAVLVFFCTSFLTVYVAHRGFRRTVQFWSQSLPCMAEYYWLQFHASCIFPLNETQWKQADEQFHRRTAPKAVKMAEKMGGIYVKVGQALSTMATGVIPEEYIDALRPLQDGITPRPYETIAAIIEESTGRKMDDMFQSFEPVPVGAATIAQAHRAVLKQQPTPIGEGENMESQEVIVKVQYPDVAELFDADLKNLELFGQLFLPARNRDLLRSIRKRHEQELDFRQEAENLRECAYNMQQHGLEPSRVRIPRVRNETGICNRNVLVMEYLHGIGLWAVVEQEQSRIARAMGKKDAEELRYMIAQRIKEHFEQGGGENLQLVKLSKFCNTLGPFAMFGLRSYAHLREQVTRGAHRIAALGRLMIGQNVPKKQQLGSEEKVHFDARQINLGKVLKTLIHVHGLQALHDGKFNSDPHQGNGIVMEDGRLGLLDYGMVGRLTVEGRENVARTVIALAENDREEVARIYLESGYDVRLKGELLTDPNILHRLASTHLDKIDLTPIVIRDGKNPEKGSNNGALPDVINIEKIHLKEIVDSLEVYCIPHWIIQIRRLGRLLMGVSAQAARPVSLAKEWEGIARQALSELKRKKIESERPIGTMTMC